MARYCVDPSAEKRTKLNKPGDWELQILETNLSFFDNEDPIAIATWILLCSDDKLSKNLTDQLNHEFTQTNWTSVGIAANADCKNRTEALLKQLTPRVCAEIFVIYVGWVHPKQTAEIQEALLALKNARSACHFCVYCESPEVRNALTAADSFIESAACSDFPFGFESELYLALSFAGMIHAALAAPIQPKPLAGHDIIAVLGNTGKLSQYIDEAVPIHDEDWDDAFASHKQALNQACAIMHVVSYAFASGVCHSWAVRRFLSMRGVSFRSDLEFVNQMPVHFERSAIHYREKWRIKLIVRQNENADEHSC